LRDLSVIVLLLVVLALQQRVVELGKRFHAVYLIKKKKGESVLVQIGQLISAIFCCCKKGGIGGAAEGKKNDFDKVNKNVASIIFSYNDAKDVARLSHANKHIHQLTENWVVWKNILED